MLIVDVSNKFSVWELLVKVQRALQTIIYLLLLKFDLTISADLYLLTCKSMKLFGTAL